MDIEKLVRTRQSLHALAEHLLAGDLARRTGRIGLRPSPGGFAQPEVVDERGRHRLRIDGTDLVVLADDTERWHPLTTAEELAAFAGAELGAPIGAYDPETSLDPLATLDVDPTSAQDLAAWFDLASEALEVVRRRHQRARPSIVQLWPEHFDVACTISKVNVGGSPGDAAHPEPYLYVGPWEQQTGPFWNEPWGASLAWGAVPDVDAAVAFIIDGLERAGA